jgi:cysteine desulfurase
MIYLDYAANTPVDERVLDSFVDATRKYIANPNSSHEVGVLAKDAIDDVSKMLANYFDCDKEGIIYTSGASESNNLVIKGVVEYKKGKKIIISGVEHSSIVAPCNYLASKGIDVSVIPLDSNGIVNLEELKKELDNDTCLVSICSVDSELGTVQPIDEIGRIVKEFNKDIIFHTDATQAIGKTTIDFSNVDFLTFAPHKFFGLNGFGCLVNRYNNKLVPIIHGGKSTTLFRSGTPVTANVIALDKAFELATSKLNERSTYIQKLNNILREEFKNLDCVHINSPENTIPNTLNISLVGKDTKNILKELEEHQIYLSTTTACALGSAPSKSVLAITGSEELASNTIRISISHLTSEEDIHEFIKVFKELLNNN